MASPPTRRIKPARLLEWIVPAVVLALAAAASLAATADVYREAATEDLFPTDPGTTWTYEASFDGEVASRVVRQVLADSIVNVEGRNHRAVAIRDIITPVGEGDPTKRIVYYEIDGADAIEIAERDQEAFKPTTPPLPLVKSDMSPGVSWDYDGLQAGLPTEIASEVKGRSDVSVPAGDFDDCTEVDKSVVTTEDGSRDERSSEDFLCPGVGLAKRVLHPSQGGEFLLELVAFAGVGRASKSGVTDVSGPVALGDGLGPARSGAIEGNLDLHRVRWSIARSFDAHFGLVGTDAVRVLGERDGTVTAWSESSGETLWRVKAGDGLLASPVIAGDLVVVGDAKRRIIALDLETGAAVWMRELPDLLAAEPLVADGLLIVPSEDASVRALDVADGSISWSVGSGGVVRAPPALAKDSIVVVDDQGTIQSLSFTGEVNWSRDLGARAAGRVATAGSLVVAGTEAGDVYGLEVEDGTIRWVGAIQQTAASRAAIAQGRVVIRYGEKRVLAADARTGELLWRASLPKGGFTPPLIVGDSVVVQSRLADIFKLDLATGELEDSVRLPLPSGASTVVTNAGLSRAGDSLVVAADLDAPYPAAIHYAFPLSESRSNGVSFDMDVVRVPDFPTTEIGRVGGRLVFGGFTGVYSSAGSDGTKTLLETDLAPDEVSAAEDSVIVRQGDEVAAFSPDGGRLWQATVPPGDRETVSATSEDVLVAESGKGLTALDPGSGDRAWFHPARTRVLGFPAEAPDGDILFGPGGLSRLDAGDGRDVWKADGFVSIGSLATGGGAVYAAGDLRGEGMIAAFSLEDGTRLWDRPLQPGLGVAYADGVVVTIDRLRIARAYDAADGSELWTHTLYAEPSTNPLAVAGNIVLAEEGRGEDSLQRDNDLIVLDPRTGRFLGSLEPVGGILGSPAPSVSGADVLLSWNADSPAVGVLRLVGP